MTAILLQPGAASGRAQVYARPRADRARLDFVDGLRGLAILMVFAYHCWPICHYPLAHWWNPVRYGFAGVNLFLVISGFCLYWPMVKRGGPAREPRLLDFARRRAKRILPPYYAALALCVAMWFVFPGFFGGAKRPGVGWLERTVAWHTLMAHNLRPDHIWALDGPLWSLPLEMDLYLAMPILVIIARRWTIRHAVAVAALVTVAYRTFINAYVGWSPAWQSLGHQYGYVLVYFFPGRWIEFALGMWAARLVADGGVRRGRQLLLPLAVACLLGGGAAVGRDRVFSPISDPLFGCGFFLLLLATFDATKGTNRIAGLIAQRPMARLGTVSYSFYLLHVPVLQVLASLSAAHLGPRRYVVLACVLVYFPITVLVAWVFYWLFERPFLSAAAKNIPIETKPFTAAPDLATQYS